ncbi:hypothetical protein Tco_0446770 [Tanacetum coccineum]
MRGGRSRSSIRCRWLSLRVAGACARLEKKRKHSGAACSDHWRCLTKRSLPDEDSFGLKFRKEFKSRWRLLESDLNSKGCLMSKVRSNDEIVDENDWKNEESDEDMSVDEAMLLKSC